MSNHVILVAIVVEAPSHQRSLAMGKVMVKMNSIPGFTEWWIADDGRTDGSDRDSAVFCHLGDQHLASSLLFEADLTDRRNIVPAERGHQLAP